MLRVDKLSRDEKNKFLECLYKEVTKQVENMKIRKISAEEMLDVKITSVDVLEKII